MLCQIQRNQVCSPLKISQSINVKWCTCDRNSEDMYSCFYESKKFRFREKHGVERIVSFGEKKEDNENIYFKALSNRLWLTSKLIRRVKVQQNCLRPIFNRIEFMKR